MKILWIVHVTLSEKEFPCLTGVALVCPFVFFCFCDEPFYINYCRVLMDGLTCGNSVNDFTCACYWSEC